MNGTRHIAGGLWLLLLLVPVVHASQLSLKQAEQVAVDNDPMLAGIQAQSRALHEKSVADGQLPDPKVKLGLANFPTDTFRRDQEPMTQLQLGVSQMFPRGNSLQHLSRRTALMADGEQARAQDQRGKARRATRHAWLETYYWIQAGDIVRQNKQLFLQLANITRRQYATGRSNQQDVIRAELEAGLLDDRLTRISTMEQKNRAQLARWVGTDMARLPLSAEFPVLPGVRTHEQLLSGLTNHPSLQTVEAQVAARQQTVALAREAYKPAWSLDVTYGNRDGLNNNGSERADFLSAMVVVDVPIFTSKRQDKRLAASQFQLDAGKQMRETRQRELVQMLDESHANYLHLGERIRRYEDALLPQAQANAQAALNAYQSEKGDFTKLMRARITDLETRLQALRLRVDHARAQAELIYLAGEDQ